MKRVKYEICPMFKVVVASKSVSGWRQSIQAHVAFSNCTTVPGVKDTNQDTNIGNTSEPTEMLHRRNPIVRAAEIHALAGIIECRIRGLRVKLHNILKIRRTY